MRYRVAFALALLLGLLLGCASDPTAPSSVSLPLLSAPPHAPPVMAPAPRHP